MKEIITLQFTRYRDKNGNPTCGTNFADGNSCEFFRAQRFGTIETCLFAPAGGRYLKQLERRESGLIPGDWCPLFKK